MFGSIYIGLSGLNAYSKGLQAISNNVANLNSNGFKSSTVSFSDLAGVEGNGGGQYASGQGAGGFGVTMGDPLLDLAQGELRQTDRDLDLAIDGSGFLMVMKGDQLFYTRTGSFEVDKDGYVVLSGTDYRLATLDDKGHPVSLSIDALRTSPPSASTKVTFTDNLSSTITKPVSISDITVYDQNGGQHVWTATFTKDATTPNQFSVSVVDATGKTIGTAQTLKFSTAGVIDPTTATLTFTDSDAALSVGFDFSGVSSFSGADVSTLTTSDVDGYGLGTISTVAVNDSGQLEISYSNEQKTDLGAIAIADFRNADALKQQNGGLFTDPGTAERSLYASGDARVGKVQSRRLEASNVDLSQAFSDLILIQRGFQASSQIISVTNDMIQQLFGIRGQG